MKKFIFLFLTIFASTSFMVKASLYFVKYLPTIFPNNVLRFYSTTLNTKKNNIQPQDRRLITVTEEPSVRENPEFPFKNLSVLKHVASESSTEKTPLEKALIEDTKSSIDRALQDELNRIYAAELKNKE